MRERTRIIIGLILIGLGIATMSGVEASGILLIIQALPFYIASTTVDPSAKRGMFWDSAHGPPFLNDSGAALVGSLHLVLGIAFILWGTFAKPQPPANIHVAGGE